MGTNQDHQAFLRAKIETEVYTPWERERFFPEGGQWIMDFRRVFMQAETLDAYTELFYERFKDEWPFQVGGAEVAAIPLVTAIALKMREKGKPVNAFFIRKSRKKTGLLKMVEGKITGDPVILVDDLINRGGTFERQVLVAEEAHVPVRAVFAVLRFRPLEYYRRFSEKGIRVESLFTLDDFHASIGTKLLTNNERDPLSAPFEIAWRFCAEHPLLELVVRKSGLASDGEKLYFGTDQGTLFALSPSDGSIVWRFDLWPALARKRARSGRQIFSTPVIAGESVYFGASDGNVYCLDRKTGKKRWVSFEADWIDSDLLLFPVAGILAVPASYGFRGRAGGITLLDCATGKKRAEIRLSGRPSGMCADVGGGRLYASGQDGTLSCIAMRTNSILWTFRTTGSIAQAPVLDETNTRIIASSMDGSVYCLDADRGDLLWRFENGLANYAAPIIWKNLVFASSLDKNVYALDLATGEKKWEFMTRARIFASPRVYHDRLYVGGNDAELRELDPRTGKLTGNIQVTERITTPLYYDATGDRYYLITYANEVYALKRKA